MNGARLVRAGVLGVWGGFFLWLWTTGEMTRYLGPRTEWVALFGGVTLAAAAAATAVLARDGARTSVPSREWVGMLVVVAPLITLLAVPGAGLGSLAASRRAPGEGGSLAAGLTDPVPGEGAPSFDDIHFARDSEEYAAAAGISDGMKIELTGFAAHYDDTPEAMFHLTRFFVSCCAADAVPYSVPVVSNMELEEDQWVRVTGTLETTPQYGYVLEPTSIEKISEPDDPYLS